LADGGADFIKVYDSLSREAYFAIMDEARRRRIPVDGHLPFRVSPQEAADAGQRTFEHLLDMAFGCSTAVEAVRKDSERALATYSSLPFSEQLLIPFRRERALYDSRDPNACTATIQAYKRNGVAVVPTLVIGHNNRNADIVLSDRASMRLIPGKTRDEWRQQAGSELSKEIGSLMRPTGPALFQNVRLLNQAGVPILAGTDLGNPMLVPGISLHQELALLVEAGLSPLQALQAATLTRRAYLGSATRSEQFQSASSPIWCC
jgi:imidazolonepropionase-like amidohydrolase